MTIHARRNVRSRRPLHWVALLVLAPGCSESPANGPKLTPVLDHRGLITYRYEVSEPLAATSIRPNVLPGLEQQIDAMNRQRRNDVLAYQESMRDRAEQQVREQRAQQAYHDAWMQTQRDQRRLQYEEQRRYQRQWSEAFHQQRQRAQFESLERDRAKQDLDVALQRNFQQQQEAIYPRHGWN